jgi:hypothetical protein
MIRHWLRVRTGYRRLAARPAFWAAVLGLAWLAMSAFALASGAVDIPLAELGHALVDRTGLHWSARRSPVPER